MRAVRMVGQDYVVITPAPGYTVVLLRSEFIEGLKRAKAWSRRQRQAAREAQAAPAADKVRDDLVG